MFQVQHEKSNIYSILYKDFILNILIPIVCKYCFIGMIEKCCAGYNPAVI
jgi:hypothetical protein